VISWSAELAGQITHTKNSNIVQNAFSSGYDELAAAIAIRAPLQQLQP
jgi:hypothetical protein